MQRFLSNSPQLFIFCALVCEARPIIDRYALKKIQPPGVFDIYQHNTIVLTITGPGKANMAAGIAYTLALLDYQPMAVMINVGIAGHKQAELGSLFAAEKITDFDSAKNHYPQLLPHSLCATLPLNTVSRPQQNYALDSLYDMEASAFYEVAARFTCNELILSLKIVSDNEQSSVSNINAKQVTEWINLQMETVCRIFELLLERTQLLNYSTTGYFEELTSIHHFTVSEKVQLKALLSRWEILSAKSKLPLMPAQFKTTRAFLESLAIHINRLPVLL